MSYFRGLPECFRGNMGNTVFSRQLLHIPKKNTTWDESGVID